MFRGSLGDILLQSQSTRSQALVFISHDTRDADLAEAFSNLLLDVSGGLLKSFRSSDTKGTSGIEFGEEWCATIISRLSDATDVVALLSQESVQRPWILYEAGVAKGKLETTVIGVALGVPLERVVSGPFGQFQNCADDEDSLTKLAIQLLKRNPDAAPREEAIRSQVRLFRQKIESILKARGKQPAQTPTATSEQNAAKLFEEVKAMVRELPERIDSKMELAERRGLSRRRSRLYPRMLEELAFSPELRRAQNGEAMSLLIGLSVLRDDFPWIYEVGIDFYRSLRIKPSLSIKAARDLLAVLRVTTSSSIVREFAMRDNHEALFALQNLERMIEHILAESSARHRSRVDVSAEPAKDGQ